MRIKIPNTTFQGVPLEGGWEAEIPHPSFDVSEPRIQHMVRSYMRMGAPRFTAENVAVDALEDLWRAIWRERLMKAVGRWHKLYREANFGSSEGFDAEKVAATWIPGADFNELVAVDMKKLFAEMRKR